jgi:hypothetical protein
MNSWNPVLTQHDALQPTLGNLILLCFVFGSTIVSAAFLSLLESFGITFLGFLGVDGRLLDESVKSGLNAA